MRLRSFSVLLAAALCTSGFAFGQDAGLAPGGGSGAAGYDWLSPAPLAWNPVNFNWADLPVKVYAHESGGFNSNIFSVGPGVPLPKGQVSSDYFLRTEVGASTKINVEAQQFFVDLTQSTTDYRHDIEEDLHNHMFDAGVNWRAGSHCDGKLMASDSVAQAPQELLAGPGIDNLTTQAFNETGQCHLYQDINVILNADAISTRHSLASAQPLDNNATDVQGGLQYQWASIDNIQALIKYTNTNYTYRQQSYSDLPEYVRLLNYGLTYTNQVTQVFDFTVMGGFTQSLGLASATNTTSNGSPQPVYSILVNYHPTPKWGVSLASSRSVTPPTTIITNATTQTSTSQSANLTYALTPKMNLTAALSLSTNSAPGATNSLSAVNSYLYGASTVLTTSLGANYLITPFTSLTFSATRSIRQINGANGTNTTNTANLANAGNYNTNIVMIGLDYRPQ